MHTSIRVIRTHVVGMFFINNYNLVLKRAFYKKLLPNLELIDIVCIVPKAKAMFQRYKQFVKYA